MSYSSPVGAPTIVSSEISGAKQHSFYPYADNGGSILGISSDDFVVIAGDTRSTSGYSINSRVENKVFRIGDDERIALSVVGFGADGKQLAERLNTVAKMYKFKHGKSITVEACAHRLSTLLYDKRFFPYQLQAILGGIDQDGKGALYSYDPVGCYDRYTCRGAGSGASLMIPFLDSAVQFKNQYVPGDGKGAELQERPREVLSREDVVSVIKDAFDVATERHIEVGDGIQMMIVSKDGIQETFMPLKKD
ncbi:Proteasome subunit beta type-6 [Clarireedia jacksonii]